MSEEQEFIKWSKQVPNQQGNIFSNQTIVKMVEQLKNIIPKKLNEIDSKENYKDLFEITNVEEIEKIKERFSRRANGDLYSWDWNEQGHGFGSSAIHRYIKYLKSKNEKVIIENKIKNIILYGPPGVGKTHNYQRLISMIEEGRDEKTIFDTVTNNQSSEKIVLDQEIYQKIHKEERVEFITFHQSYSYEDFIEGFRPTEDGNIKLEDGIFKRVVKKAFDNQEKNYYIVIDEINRGNISKIFGELITLLEEDKRDSYEVTLPYSKEKFVIPSNLYIIATMNSTDKSIATIDIALRRRFTFLKMQPNSNLVQNEEVKALMNSLNAFIQERLGSDFLLGHSYFMGEDVDLEFIKEYKIRPLLEEYFYADEIVDIDKLLNGENNAT